MMKNEKDSLLVSAKKQAADCVGEYYAAFGWTMTERREDDKYADTENMRFERPHFIKNKDDLQYLQAQFERSLNRLGVYEMKKTERATIVGIAVGLLGAAFVGGGICLMLFIRTLWAYIIGSFMCGIGCQIFFVCGLAARRILADDKQKYSALMSAEQGEILKYCREAEAMRRDNE